VRVDGSVGVTGTPGTGKKSVSRILAHQLGLKPSSLNSLADGFRLVDRKSGEVDTTALGARISRLRVKGGAVYYGHLLPYVFAPEALTKVVVLRCEPGVLKKRLAERGYPDRKLIDNVEAELIGLVSSDAFAVYGDAKALELDTTHTSPQEAALTIAKVLRGEARAQGRIDWTVNYGSGAKLRLLLSTGK